ncbi:hypothetical protein [uncultured Tateyamaria sp.]|uniref:calcium-binding protein n=1 Tax=uncultured Tateyamaria sp. TaxID=455651 RepID=UPI002622893F|nr:hypothetical protein [uncultured Tateyamaria sp.]
MTSITPIEDGFLLVQDSLTEGYNTFSLAVTGVGLTLSPAGGFGGGLVTGYTFSIDWSPEAEALGLEDETLITATSISSPAEGFAATAEDLDTLFTSMTLVYVFALGEVAGPYDSFGGLVIDGADKADIVGSGLNDIVQVLGDGAVVRTGNGNDVALAAEGAGSVTFVMGAGDDRAEGSAARDGIAGGTGNDTLSGFGGNDRLNGGGGDDHVFGGAGADILLGGAGDDVLLGGASHDRLDGGDGNDVLRGDAGLARLTGGAGQDAFVFVLNEGMATPDTATRAVILDFEQDTDMLWFGPTDNATYTAQEAFDLFSEHATQRGAHVVVDADGLRLVIANADLDAFDVTDFVDGAAGVSIFAWADTLA